MKIIRAAHLGMCFGVKDAIALARETARHAPLTILGDLVHNEAVLADLRRHGIDTVQTPAEAATRTVMITAHGASQRRLAEARCLGRDVREATCPLVRLAHRSLAALVHNGFHPVIVGQREHVEVRGMIEDLMQYDVVLGESDVLNLPARPKFGVVAQTTQPVERVRYLVALLRERFPQSEVRFLDTVCQPTKQRQDAAVELAQQCSVVIVVGGARSNNTRELARTCETYCRRVHHVQTGDDLCAEWFRPDDVVGLTAGTSTPDDLIAAVEQRLQQLEKTYDEKCLA